MKIKHTKTSDVEEPTSESVPDLSDLDEETIDKLLQDLTGSDESEKKEEEANELSSREIDLEEEKVTPNFTENSEQLIRLKGIISCDNCPMASFIQENEDSQGQYNRCDITGNMTRYGQGLKDICCPLIKKEQYDQEVIDKYVEEHPVEPPKPQPQPQPQPQIIQLSPEEEEEKKLQNTIVSVTNSFNDTAEMVQKLINNRQIGELEGQIMIWGALMTIHNTAKEKLPMEFVYQLMGSFASRRFSDVEE